MMDHRRSYNTKVPIGNIRKSPDINAGFTIDGVHYVYASMLYDVGIFQEEDCRGLSDFELSDTTDDAEDHIVNSHRNVFENDSTEDGTDEMNKIIKYRKKDHGRRVISAASTHVPYIHMKKEKEDCQKRKDVWCKKRKREFFCETKRVKTDDDCSCESSDETPPNFIKENKLQLSIYEPPVQECVVKNNEVALTQEIFGYFFCEICNLNMSSEKVYFDHMSGKRHRKNIKLKYVDQAAIQSIPPSAATEGQSKYPKPPHGVRRRKVKERAKIQDVIKNEVKKPCPGLNLVTEIQGLKETTYYCSMCNAICSPNSILSHLTGFKHQLNSIKHFRPGDYEYMSFERKNLIQDRIVGILRSIQRREGIGRMAVEVEELMSDSSDGPCDTSQPSTSKDVRGTSIKLSGMSFTEYYDKATIPDKSAADFYCEYCDAHMNSEDMWQAHISGKRHITNLKKLPGDRPSKSKTVPLANTRAKLLDRFEKECPNEPIVGLNEIREIQIKETKSESYNCFICCSCHTTMDIIEHIVSLKHRKKYLDHIDYPYMQYISGMSEMAATPIIRNICAQKEAEYGCGTPSVHMNRSAFYA